ncbi:MAG: NAD(P)H-dependent oxidoreductase [Thermoguttaceae bacterium]
MSIVTILAHPSPTSFNHAIAERVRDTLELRHERCVFHSLYAESFDPVLPVGEETLDEAALPSNVRQFVAEVREASGIVIVHPNWWGSPPAILRGWVDRVFRHGFAYNFTATGPVPHFTNKTVQVFTTSNTPRDIEMNLHGDPLETHWRKIVFGLCGCKSFERRNFEPVIMSTPEERKTWLEEVAATIERRF